ncbi:MAG: transglutaminase domain-containing protein, partial [Verrucomicrobiae bacterium]|nr:transglutaminase domain-containing protein [Verrucomicrobiae bacterium]
MRGVTMTSIFSPSSVRAEAAPPCLNIEAVAFRDNGADMIFPRFQMEWSPATDKEATIPRFGSIPREWGVMWLDSEESSLGTTRFRLIEHGNRYDQTVPFVPELAFETPSSAKFLVLCPPIDKAPEPEALAKLSGTEWSVHSPDFMPETTFAVHTWLEREIPGISLFGKVLAFRLPAVCSELGKAVLVFIEPISTGHTLSQTVQLLMKRQEAVDRFYDAIDALLETGFTKAPPERLAQFWLPQELRKETARGERDVYEAWLRLRYGEGGRLEDDASLDVAYKYLCTYCEKTLEGTSRWGRGAFHLRCCRQDAPVTILATTNDKRFAPVHELLAPWAPEESLPPLPVDPLAAVINLWRLVAENTRYRFDRHSKDGVRDCWLEPAEMWKRGVGDCEDHSILLVSMIQKLVPGVRPWLVVGTMGDGGGHAWVMISSSATGQEYLIEATRKCVGDALEAVNSPEHDNYLPEWRCD